MKQLVDYGIQNERSDIRVHVCPTVRRVYTYPTSCGIDAINTGKYRARLGYQPGVEYATAKGYLIPPMDIPRCVCLQLPDIAWGWIAFRREDSTTTKGDKATRLVAVMLKRGMLPIPALGVEVACRDLQISGTDIFVPQGALRDRSIHIQVKCDFDGGSRELGGTGNLFLQVAECNPLGRH